MGAQWWSNFLQGSLPGTKGFLEECSSIFKSMNRIGWGVESYGQVSLHNRCTAIPAVQNTPSLLVSLLPSPAEDVIDKWACNWSTGCPEQSFRPQGSQETGSEEQAGDSYQPIPGMDSWWLTRTWPEALEPALQPRAMRHCLRLPDTCPSQVNKVAS